MRPWLGRRRPSERGGPPGDRSDGAADDGTLARLVAAHLDLQAASDRLREQCALLEAERDRWRAAAPPRPIRSVLFVAGEPDTPGAALRTRAHASLARATGYAARHADLPAVGPETIAGIDLLVLWRAPWSPHVAQMIALVRAAGGLIAFDVDDRVTDPELARADIIDGMRSGAIEPAALARLFVAFRRTAAEADFALATTEELANALRMANDRVYVLPNGFDERGRRAARRAARIRDARDDGDPTVRIGYAAGTRTHGRDFAVVAPALAVVLRARPVTRLVLFRDAEGPMVAVDEFPPLRDLGDRIEWRDTVPLDRLAHEIARFDIALCPLEHDNPFAAAKSEIKFVEASLAAIPTIASPTPPLAGAIADGQTGLLADTAAGWEAALFRLVDDPALRRRLGRAAAADVLWRFGPARRAATLDSILRRQEGGRFAPREAAAVLATTIADSRRDRIALPDTVVLFAYDTGEDAAVAIAITSFNYARHLPDALASAVSQTLGPLELVVVDDGSTDGSDALAVAWAGEHRDRFTRIRIERTVRNSGLGPARNAAFACAESPFVMVLDADNRLLPRCCATLLTCVQAEGAAFAYSTIRQFGEAEHPIGGRPFDPQRLIPGNYIDAMALISREVWAEAGGFYDRPDARGWEDFDLWCRFAELGRTGAWHAEPLAEYRVHAGSMTNAVTEQPANKLALVRFMEERHPWLRLRSRASAFRASDPIRRDA